MKHLAKYFPVIVTMLALSQTGFTFYEVDLPDGETDYINWVVSEIPVRIDDVLSDDLDPDDAINAIVASMNTWNDVECSHPALVNEGLVTGMALHSGEDGNNLVVFLEDEAWSSDKEERFLDAIALTTLIYDPKTGNARSFVLEVNDSNVFATDGSPGKTDLQNTLTHEFGHVLALDHTSSDVEHWKDQTMYFSAYPGETKKRSLGDDDIEGICTLYESVDLNGEIDPTGFPYGTDASGCNFALCPSPSTFGFFGVLALALMLWFALRRFPKRSKS